MADSGGSDSPVRTLFDRIAGPAARRAPDLDAIGAALIELAGDRDYLGSWMQRLGDGGGSIVIHAPVDGPRLTIVRRPDGQVSTVHDHGTWVAISPIAGCELHRRYALKGPGGRPEAVEVRSLEPGSVVTLLPPDDFHDHGHLKGQGVPSHVLIMTGADQTRYTRTEWDLSTGRQRTLRPGDAGRWLASQPLPDA